MLAEPTTDTAVGGPATSSLPVERLEEEIAALGSHLDAATCRWLELLAELDRRSGWDPASTRSCAQWLSWRCAVAPAAAREYVRVAERLGDLPLIRAAFSRGELSFAKVRELTRVADEACEQELLELAEAMTIGQLQRALRAYRSVTVEEAHEVQDAESLDWFWDEDGSLVLRARLAPEDGALVVRALERARQAARERRREASVEEARDAGEAGAGDGTGSEPTATGATGESEPHDAGCSDVDALVTLADLALAGSDRHGGDRCQLVVHVDADVLCADSGGRCELEHGPAIAAETARRLACDAGLVPLAERDGLPLSVGRRTRTVPPALRRALQARDHGCRFPGCANSRFVDAHHVRHWADGGETDLDNLLLLCRRHHRLVHEGGYTLTLTGDGDAHFTNGHGVAVPSVPRPPPGASAGLLERHEQAGLHIDGDTGRHGHGDRLDLALAAEALVDILGPHRVDCDT